MSSSVDERIVKLGFDNGKFESGVSKSMTTLDKLEEKLKFKHADEGAKNLQRAFSGFDFSVMARGIESLERRFSTMGIAGMNVVNKITDSIIGAAKRIESATIGQIKAGGWSRAMNLANAQFQIEGLGEDWNEMQKAISYGVKDTAYGLDAAASAASSLVASGVAYKESIDGANDSLMHTSLRAISGVAAMTNSSYEDISRIFTTVAGNGRLMGDQLLQLSSRGLNVAANLANAFGKTEAEIRDMVSHGQIDFETFAKAMDDAFGAHAKEANKTFTGALSNMKAALSRFGAVFATPVIEKTNTLFISLTSRIDELKGKLGDVKDEAGNVVKVGLGTHFAEMWQSAIDAFSKFFEVVDLSWFDKIVEKVDNVTVKVRDFFDTLKEYLTDSAESTAEGVSDATKTMLVSAEEAQAAKDIIERGLYGTGENRKNILTEMFGGDEEGAQHAANVQAYINSIVAAGWDYDKAAIQVAGANEEVAASEEEIAKQVKKAKIKQALATIKKVLSDTWKVTTNIAKAAKKVANAIWKAFAKVFKIDLVHVTDGVSSFSDAIVKLSEKLIVSDETADKITKVFEFFFSVIKKGISVLFNAGKGAKEFVSEFKDTNLFSRIKTGFDDFVKTVKGSSVFTWISDKITGLLDTSNDYDFFTNIKNKFIDLANNIDAEGFFGGIIKTIKDSFTSISELEFPEIELPGWLSDSSIVTALTAFVDEIGKIFKGESDAPDKMKKFFESLKDAVTSVKWDDVKDNIYAIFSIVIVYKIIKILSSIGLLIDSVTGIPDKISSILGGVATAITNGGVAIRKLTHAAGIKMVAAALLDLAIAIIIMGSIPEEDLYRGLSAMLVMGFIIRQLTRATPSIVQGGLSISANIPALLKISAGLLGFGILIAAIAAAIAAISYLASTLSGVENASVVFDYAMRALLVILAATIVIGGVMHLITKALSSVGAAAIRMVPVAASMAIAMGSISGSLIALAVAVALFAKIPTHKLEPSLKAVESMMVALISVTAAFALIAALSFDNLQVRPTALLSMAAMILVMTSAVVVLVGAVAAMALLFKAEDSGMANTSEAMAAIIHIILVIAAGMALIVYAMSKSKATSAAGIGSGILALAVFVGVVAYAINELAKSVNPKTADIALSLGAVIAAIGLALKLIIDALADFAVTSVGGDAAEMLLSISIAMIAISGSIYILALAIEKFGSMGAGSLFALTFVLVIFAAFVVLMGAVGAKVPKFIEAILSVGVAIALFGVGMFLIGAAFALVTNALAKFTPEMETFFTVLESHKWTAIIIGVAILAVIAGVVIGIIKLTQVIKPIVELITTALQTVIEAFRKFTSSTEKEGNGFVTKMSKRTKLAIIGIVGGMLAAMVSMTPEMLDTIGKILIKVLVWLGNIAGDIALGLVEFLIRLINGVADAIRLNSARIANALWSVVYALLSLLINIIREVVPEDSLVGKVLGGFLNDMDQGLNEMAATRRKEAEELDKMKKANNNYLLGIEEDTDRTDKATKMSFIDMAKSAFGFGNATGVTANAVGTNMNVMTDAVGRSKDKITQDTNEMQEALEEFNESAFANVAGVNKDAVVRSMRDNKRLKETGKKSGEAYSDSFTSGAVTGLNTDEFMQSLTEDGIDIGALAGTSTATSYTTTLTGDMYNPSAYEDVTEDNMEAVTTTVSDSDNEMVTATKEGVTRPTTETIAAARTDVEQSTNLMWRGALDSTDKYKPIIKQSVADMVKEIKAQMECGENHGGLDMHSPSRVFAHYGEYISMGLSNGIRNSTPLATDSAAELADAMIVSFGAPLDYLAKISSGEYVYDPSIRPVFDSSQIQNGARNINGLFNNQSIQLSGYTGQLAADISQLDNSNLMVVNELRQLREDMAAMTEEISNMQMVMDTGALVGQISGPIDRSLGRNMVRKGRGN